MAWRDSSTGNYKILSVKDKIVVFDAPVNAVDFAYKFCGPGRLMTVSEDGEHFFYHPIVVGQINQGCVIRGYDPYHAPSGLGITSETHGRAWKTHISVWEAFYDVGGNMKTDSDGNITNAALGDSVLGKDSRFITERAEL